MLVPLLFLLVWCLEESRASSEPDTRIVGGKEAPEGSIPWQVSMRNIEGTEYHFCGGSIIGKQWILTAAHCVKDRNIDSYEIVVGSNKLSSGGTRYKVESVIIHKDYNAALLTDDISVLKLKEEIKYADNIKAIKVDAGYVYGRENGVVSGWGYIDVSRNCYIKLLNVRTLSVKNCRNKLRDVTGPKYTRNEICALNKEGEGFCQGDSGGPLVRNNKLVGMVSWNVPCGRGYPDVYTRLSSYANWIKEHTRD
ncbi:chymotrypsin-1-like [Zerene cesonia]|uniref:chymotrypsin-1-like n=1 Tax=Zerene cesonia TaxID=33412 RepID=UPI0018E4EA6B|nr:chymotrypsin-1-like [Zerene cesonia]